MASDELPELRKKVKSLEEKQLTHETTLAETKVYTNFPPPLSLFSLLSYILVYITCSDVYTSNLGLLIFLNLQYH